MLNPPPWWRSDRVLLAAVLVAVAARLGVFLVSMAWPIPNERGEPVSPLLPQTYLDYTFYLESLRRYLDWRTVLDQFFQFYRAPLSGASNLLIAGPAFPLLMRVTGFSEGNLLPLAVLYLLLGCALTAAWLIWLRRQGLGPLALLLFALLPNPIWFILVVSTDLLFAAEFAVFYFAYFARGPASRTRSATCIGAVALMLLTRPNSFSIVLFVSVHAAWRVLRDRRIEPMRAIGLLVLVLGSTLYLYPYFVAEMGKAGSALEYFGHSPREYIAGIYHLLPHWLDLPLSWLSLLAAKLLYFTGLRPSYGMTDGLLVLLRAAPGIVLLPGLLYLLWTAPLRERTLIGLYCLPFLLGPAQDRYYLAVFPLLYLYGIRFWSRVAASVPVLRASALDSDRAHGPQPSAIGAPPDAKERVS